MANLTTKYLDSAGLNALLARIAKLYAYLKQYTDNAVANIDYTEYVTDAEYDSTNAQIIFKNQEGTQVSTIDASAFIKDGMLNAVSYDSSSASLTFSFNTDAGTSDITVDLASLVDTYAAGNGIDVADNVISAKVSSSSESYLGVDENGLYVTGIDAIAGRVSAVEAWVDEEYITADEVDEIITTLNATYTGFAAAAGITS